MEIFLGICLAISIICILIFRSEREDYKRQADNEKKRVDIVCKQEQEKYERFCAAEKKKHEELCAEANARKEFYEHAIKEFESYILKKCAIYPHLAAVQADLLTMHYMRSAHYLRTKDRPALREAQRIDELRRETKIAYEGKKLAEYKLQYIFSLAPELQKIFDTNSTVNIDIDSIKKRLEHQEIALTNRSAQLDEKEKQLYDELHTQYKAKYDAMCKEIFLQQELYKKQLEDRAAQLDAKEQQLHNLESNYQSIIPAYNRIKEYESTLCEALIPIFGKKTLLNLTNGLTTPRFLRAMEEPFFFSDPNMISATITTPNNTYTTSLTSCTCTDFQVHHQPCKHMIWFAAQLGILIMNNAEQDRILDNIQAKLQRAIDEQKKADLKEKQAVSALAKLNAKESAVAELDTIIQSKCNSYPYIAATMADLLTIHYTKAAEHLSSKKRPAYTEAIRIKDLKKETASIIAEKKVLEYKMAQIHAMFPNIDDIFDDGFNEDATFELETEENTDRVRLYLSTEEYHSLSVTAKNQLALDRYIAKRKSKWQIGRDYEMYIGHLCEKEGYQVRYTGILENLEDMGRDLIVTNDSATYIVQCKNWSKEKVIHEKHVFQLFGTITLYNLDHPKSPARGVFVSTTQLSNKAVRIAKELSIKVIYVNLGEFPRIKCNINRTTGEKIYHLPFDQQYDRVVIDPACGECYAFTVEEAENQGFRRAFRHFAS